jgi:uncharacterized RDD family membrane protein YckC
VPDSSEAPTFASWTTHISGRRFLAHLADGVALTVVLIVLLIPAALIADVLIIVVFLLWFTVGHIAYFVLTQRRHGQSPGKRFTGLRVIDAHGNTPSSGALARRTVPLLVEYLYIVAFIGMMSSPYRQRLGDRWARTYVVDVKAPRS